MSTFWTIYLLSVIINLVVVRGLIWAKVVKPEFGVVLVVFMPIMNAFAAVLFLIFTFLAALKWIATGTLDADS